jgi:hypothetical protein
VTAVALLVVVMLVTFGRRPIRRKLIMVPIGVLLHLVLDAAFTRTKVFWWPLAGGALARDRVPSFDRGFVVPVVLEVVGAVLIVLTWRHVQLDRGEL